MGIPSESDANGQSPTRRGAWLTASFVLAVTLAVFARVSRQGYVCWDDGLHVYQNPHLGSLTGIAWLWRHPYGGLYVPLSYTAYALLAALARGHGFFPTPDSGPTALDPRTFHDANLLLHLANTLLVFLILHRLLRRDWAAGAGALLYAVHPMQVESVAWISELRGLLCSLFSLLSVWLSLRSAPSGGMGPARARGLFAAATLCFVCALLCKPSAVTLPLVLLAVDRWIVGQGWRRALPPMLGWLGLSAVWMVVTRGAQPLQFHPLHLWTRPVIAGDALWFYGAQLLWPARLGPDYGRTPPWAMHHAGELTALLAGLLLALLLLRYRNPQVLGAALLSVAALLPVLGLVPFAFQLYSTVADRYAALALLGPALLLTWLLIRCEKLAGLRTAAPALAAALLCACAVRSSAQVRVWDNALTFTSNALAVNPRSWVMHYNRGKYWEQRGEDGSAVSDYGQAIADNPVYADAYSNLGDVLLRHRMFAQADTDLRAALRLNPALPQPHVALALSLTEQGDDAAAAPEWQQAVNAWPDAAVLRYNLGMALLRLGRTPEAAVQFRRLLAREPRFAPAHVALAQCLRQSPPPAGMVADPRTHT